MSPSSPHRLWTALSPAGAAAPPVLAVLDPAQSGSGGSLRVRLYDLADTAGAPPLLTTLTHRADPADDDGAGDNEVRALFLVGASLLCAATRRRAVLWDLARGVAAATHAAAPGTAIRHACGVRGDGADRLVYLLVAPAGPAAGGDNDGDAKCQVHVFDTVAQRLLRKVKVGKGARQIAAAGAGAVLVRTARGLKLIDTQTGRKLQKVELLEGTEDGGDNRSLAGLAVAHGTLAVTRTPTELFAVDFHAAARPRVRRFSLPDDGAVDAADPEAVQLAPLSGAEDGSCLVALDTADLYLLDPGNNDADAALRPACRVVGAAGALRGLAVGAAAVAVVVTAGDGDGELGVRTRRLEQVLPTEDDVAPVSWDLAAEGRTEVGAIETSGRKRRTAADILGPGRAGGEARHLSEGGAPKRSKSDGGADEMRIDGSDEDDEEEDGGPTVAERLAQLQKALDEESDQDDRDEAEQAESRTSFVAKRATTESLSQLLQQALQSGDDPMLELALQVRDRTVIEESCRELSQAHATMLLTALTTRLAMKPGRADHMCAWLSMLLQTNKIKSVEHLQPLQNLLQERIDIFPALLKLEGRLAMMGSS